MGLSKSRCSHQHTSMTTSGTTSGWKGTWRRHLFKWTSSYRRCSLLPPMGTSSYSSTVSSSWVSSEGGQFVTELEDGSAELGQDEIITTGNSSKPLWTESPCSRLLVLPRNQPVTRVSPILQMNGWRHKGLQCLASRHLPSKWDLNLCWFIPKPGFLILYNWFEFGFVCLFGFGFVYYISTFSVLLRGVSLRSHGI